MSLGETLCAPRGVGAVGDWGQSRVAVPPAGLDGDFTPGCQYRPWRARHTGGVEAAPDGPSACLRVSCVLIAVTLGPTVPCG